METTGKQVFCKAQPQFKSYYVVWKLEKNKEKKTNISGFKSYYVVWKPRFIAKNPKIIGRFKSYYVVWKPKHSPKTKYAMLNV